MNQCYRGPEDSKRGSDHCKPGSGEGFREELTLELDFKGKVEIEQMEKMERTYSREQERHKGREQDREELDKVGCRKRSVRPEVETHRGK